MLLQNAKVWRVRKGGPILVVCYTNHALDQFLEEIHEFHPRGIVRVGGRSQSEAMQECNLTKRKREMIEVTDETYNVLTLFANTSPSMFSN